MSDPKRIQRKRTAGWKLSDYSDNAVYVGRPSAYANPYRIEKRPDGVMILRNPNGIRFASLPNRSERSLSIAHAIVTNLFETFVTTTMLDSGFWSLDAYDTHTRLRGALVRGDLRGKDLSCWCAPTLACHVDVWLRISNEVSA